MRTGACGVCILRISGRQVVWLACSGGKQTLLHTLLYGRLFLGGSRLCLHFAELGRGIWTDRKGTTSRLGTGNTSFGEGRARVAGEATAAQVPGTCQPRSTRRQAGPLRLLRLTRVALFILACPHTPWAAAPPPLWGAPCCCCGWLALQQSAPQPRPPVRCLVAPCW